jgi:hypothetical protein
MVFSISVYTAMLRVDSRRHTQILYKETRKMLLGAQKNKGKKRIGGGRPDISYLQLSPSPSPIQLSFPWWGGGEGRYCYEIRL